jgi:LacI family transcriptional regulator
MTARSGHGRGKTPTIRDVARSAGVSAATVSRVLNGQDIVSDQIREKVRHAIAAMGYVPNASARALASSRTRTIGAVVPTIAGSIFAKIVQSMQKSLEEGGYALILAASEYSLSREFASVRALLDRGVDAVVLVGSRHDAKLYRLIEHKRVPLVLTCTYDPASKWSTVGWDNKAGSAKIAAHAFDIGHRRFGIIGGLSTDNDRATERVEGFVEALHARGVEIARDAIIESRYDLAESGRAMRQLLARSPSPTAILCGNDVLATGALLECLRLGVRVPADVSIAGYDDLDVAAQLVPSLTTVRIPAERVGHLAARGVMAMLDHQPEAFHFDLELDVVLRGTTAPPR